MQSILISKYKENSDYEMLVDAENKLVTILNNNEVLVDFKFSEVFDAVAKEASLLLSKE